ncbi:MAG: DUF4112 domain-containing protein [Bacteriovoracia bacterium]
MEKNQKSLDDLRSLSNLLDSKFRGPFGTRFGLDGLLGLIPGVGDIITSALSVYIIAEAAAAGVPPATLTRMAFNVILENIFDMIPIIGNFFDFYWKANNRNMQLIEGHLLNPKRETIKSRMIVGLVIVSLLILIGISFYFSYQVLAALFHWITSLNTD